MSAAVIRFPTERVEHDTCPKCGKLLLGSERRGGATAKCNECLSAKSKPAKRRKTVRRAQWPFF